VYLVVLVSKQQQHKVEPSSVHVSEGILVAIQPPKALLTHVRVGILDDGMVVRGAVQCAVLPRVVCVKVEFIHNHEALGKFFCHLHAPIFMYILEYTESDASEISII
jgi:hypothetical protein